MRFVLRALVAVALTATLLGLSVLLLLQPAVTRTLSGAFSESRTAGLSRTETLALAEKVRAFVAEKRGTLPATVHSRPGFDEAAVSHLRDVARVMSGARIATLIFGAACLVWLFVLLARGRLREISAGLAWGAVLSAVFVVVVAVLSATSFDAVFTAFHGLFFKAGTWQFPADSLLIELFPEPFWKAAGAAWGGLVLVGAAVLGIASALVRRASRIGR